MDSLDQAISLARTGRFSDALNALNLSPNRTRSKLLHAELLERTGAYTQSRFLTTAILESKATSNTDRSACELVVGLLDWADGDISSAITHLQRASVLAVNAKQPETSCWARLRLLVLLCDQSGPDAVATLLPKLRADILRTGSAHLLAALHIFVGQSEAKRGLLRSAMKHSHAGQTLLARDPNVWLESTSENTQTAIFIMLSNFDEALAHAERAIDLANRSGALSARVASLGNIGNLLFQTGKFDTAAEYLNQVIALTPSGSEHLSAVSETLAQIYMADGQIARAKETLDAINSTSRVNGSRQRYVLRHTELTRTKLLNALGKTRQALGCADDVIELARQSGDRLLEIAANLAKVDVLLSLNKSQDAIALLGSIAPQVASCPPTVYAEYEALLGLALASQNTTTTAKVHIERANTVLKHLHSVPLAAEMIRRCQFRLGVSDAPQLDDRMDPAAVLQTIALMLAHSKRSGLIAEQLVALLRQLGCCRELTLISSECDCTENSDTKNDNNEHVDSFGRLAIGADRNNRILLEAKPKPDIESQATLNAIGILVSAIHELERARTEREERLTLWPIEDVPIMNDHAVVNGAMRTLMDRARRVASTSASVLVTGESGTGKEILARAVHTLSDRADQPFVPFNCAAIPRDMLESQLFGHRRGAFTGADRDNPGLIRAARGGTLFLDEIGELSLELQPKLLRFLESNEICPLGETSPFSVDVRVVAATNAKLDQAVKAGRFRDDLYYRLNVVRLEIPPLRERRDELPSLVHHFVTQAAIEYKKGHVRVAENTMEQLLLASWPGNIRQLQNEIRRMIAFADPDAILTPDALSSDIAIGSNDASSHDHRIPALNAKLNPTLARVEREMIQAALREHNGKMDAAAKALGISGFHEKAALPNKPVMPI